MLAAAHDRWRRFGALRRVEEAGNGVRAARRGGEDGAVVAALDLLEQRDEKRVVEEVVFGPPPSTARLSTWSTSTPRARIKDAMPSGREYGPEKSTSARRDVLPAAGKAAGTCEASEAATAGAAGGAEGGAGTPGGC